MITQIFESFTSKFIESFSKKEFRRRLFLQECRFNLSLLSLLDWKNVDGNLNSYILPKLKTEFTEMMLKYHDNDIISDMKKLFELSPLFLEDGEKASNQIEIFSQIINKITIIKIIAEIPQDLKKFDRSKIDERISNLRNLLIEIIKVIESNT